MSLITQSFNPQRSPEWYEERRGKFTSSQASKLLGIKGIGETGRTYAFELAVDIVEGIDEAKQSISYDMQHGIDTEPYGFEQFRQNKSLEFLEVHKCGFFTLNKDVGGSPDGIVSNNMLLEIKCPKDLKLFRLVCDGIIDKEYLDQMQHQMWTTATEHVYHFNYIIHKGEPKWHEILVHRDEKTIDLLKVRTKDGIEVRDEYVEKLIKNRQY